MLDLLQSPQHNPSVVTWHNIENMEFRVNDSTKLGAFWGKEKDNETMNFDKLSRAIRFYYKKNVFQPVANKRLIYKFGAHVKDSVRGRIAKDLSMHV